MVIVVEYRQNLWVDTMHVVGLCKAIETYFPVSVPGRREATDNPHALKLGVPRALAEVQGSQLRALRRGPCL